MSQPVATNDAPDTTTTTLVEALREQLYQAQLEKSRLLSLLEVEQAARRDLEQKLLPAPPSRPGKARLWVLAGVLLAALAALVITLVRPELVGRLTGG